MQELRSLADQENAEKQNNLGVMYGNGDGVPADNVYAHMCFNSAASRGHEDGRTNKERVERQMSQPEVVEASEFPTNELRRVVETADQLLQTI